MKKERLSNIELLRIIMMLIIIYSHFSSHSNFVFEDIGLNRILMPMTRLGELGVTCFLLISGYFSINKKNLPIKAVNLLIEVWFYNVVIICMLVVLGKPLTFEEILKNVIPIYNTHWFAYTFVFLYILAPFINIFLKKISQNNLSLLLIILGVTWGVVYPFTGADLNFSYLGWFIFLYMKGAYLSLYPEKANVKKMLLIASLCIAILWGSTIIFSVVDAVGLMPLERYVNYFYSMYSPFIWILGIVLFRIFLELKIKTSKIINTISSSTFAVYLISDNKYLRNVIWNEIFMNTQFSNSGMLFMIGLLETVAIFCVCIIVDKARIYIFKKLKIEVMVEAAVLKINYVIKKIEGYIFNEQKI